uniref:Uncharacterized protein n=1 Tax=Sphaeramia orbicularis TaxID=375764 RepID=A0A673B4S3_9TELE
ERCHYFPISSLSLCTEDKGTLFHCLWSCPKVEELWEQVKLIIQEILSIRLDREPKLFLLGLYPEGHNINQPEQIFLNIWFLQAKRVIVLTWKNMGKPSVPQWVRELALSPSGKNYFYT